ncbi:hypothetical protein NP233_g5146 [Leucocoprinus birnbaumii]|uniref:Uncharacterized protein n=1 Tax=Leucocoprinus birnbaumii TaxID=56174 RepID=A0AAD5YWP1_9AGAR|nr:hypothetical protein NP233_g5146 [Leucocoprinus birnbaumii]
MRSTHLYLRRCLVVMHPPPAVPENQAEQIVSSHRSSVSAGSHSPNQTLPPSNSPLPTPPTTPLKLNAGADLSSRRNDTDCTSTSSSHNRSDSRHSSSSAPPPTNPVISLTASSYRGQSPSVSSFAASASRRSNSLTQMPSISESSSMMTPSLDASSRSPTTVSTLNTIDSSSDVYRAGTGGRAKGRNGFLTIKTSEHVQTVPMIIESPAEDTVVANSGMGPEFIPLPPSPITPGPSPTLAVPQNPLLTRRGRSMADQGKQEKRKFFGSIRRGQSAPDESDKKTRRMSVSSSFVSLKRAASNWTRPRHHMTLHPWHLQP